MQQVILETELSRQSTAQVMTTNSQQKIQNTCKKNLKNNHKMTPVKRHIYEKLIYNQQAQFT